MCRRMTIILDVWRKMDGSFYCIALKEDERFL